VKLPKPYFPCSNSDKTSNQVVWGSTNYKKHVLGALVGKGPNMGAKPPGPGPGVVSNDALIVAVRTACREGSRRRKQKKQC